MDIVTRKGWGAAAPDSRTPWNVSDLDGIVQHWFGSPKAAKDAAGDRALLRAVQRGHMAPGGLGTTNGASDIAYNFAVSPRGEVFELRGWNAQSGANGTSAANRDYLAVVYMAGTGDPLTVKGKAALHKLYQEAFRRGVEEKAVTHGSITGTECPGPPVRAWLASGVWKPRPQIRFLLTDGEGKTLKQTGPVDVGYANEKKALLTFHEKTVAAELKELRADRDAGVRRVKA